MMICRSVLALLVTALMSAMAMAQPLSVTLIVFDDACGNGTGMIAAIVNGGTEPYAYAWTPSPPTDPGATLAGLNAGTYEVTITDAQGTTVTGSAEVATSDGLLPLTGPANPANACNGLCNGYWLRGGYLGGQLPYTITTEPPGGIGTADQIGITVNGLCPGTVYEVIASDADGCSSTFAGITVQNGAGPNMLAQSITPPCDIQGLGSALLYFDQNITNVIMVSGTGSVSIMGTQVMLSNVQPGTVQIYCFGASPICSTPVTIEMPAGSGDCATVVGLVYADVDGTCDPGPDDIGLPYRMLVVQPGGHHLLTSSTGTFALGLPYGDYTLDQSFSDYSAACADPFPVPFILSFIAPVASIELAQEEVLGVDVRTYLQASTYSPGWVAVHDVQAYNNSVYTITDFGLELTYDPLLELVGTTLTPSVSVPGFLRWEVLPLEAFGTFAVQAWLQVPPDAQLVGTVMDAEAAIVLVGQDADPDNDSYLINTAVVETPEPNDKQVVSSSRESTEFYYLTSDTHVDFAVRFQNTGNEEVVNVIIVDTVSTIFDLGSLEILGASHAFRADLYPDRVLQISFEGIALPFAAANEAQSHGFVAFRLKPRSSIEVGSTLSNVAHVYFDDELPLATNMAKLVVELGTSVSNREQAELQVRSNPVGGTLFITGPVGLQYVELLSTDGRVVLRERVTGPDMALSVGHLRSGLYLVRAVGGSGHPSVVRIMKE